MKYSKNDCILKRSFLTVLFQSHIKQLEGSMSSVYNILLVFLAFGSSFFLVAYLLKTPFPQYFIDKPDPRKVHQNPIPRIGGVCVIVSFLTAVAFWRYSAIVPWQIPMQVYYSTILCAGTIFVLGFLDDSIFVAVRVRHKLITEILLAGAIAAIFEVYHSQIVLFSFLHIPTWAMMPFAMIWIVGVMNAMNIIDGVDGLAGGISVIILIALSVFAVHCGVAGVGFLAILLAFASIGFLFHNFSPARVFLGDTGSLFLGAMIGMLTLYCATVSSEPFSGIVLLLITGLPILDLLVAIVRRYCKARDKKLSFTSCLHATVIPDNNHIHHRLIARGFSHAQTAVLLYVFCMLFCASAIVMLHVSASYKTALLAYTIMSIGFFLNRLGYGNRFKKALRLYAGQKAPQHRYAGPKETIGVIDSKGLIYHCLQKYDSMRYNFINVTDDPRL